MVCLKVTPNKYELLYVSFSKMPITGKGVWGWGAREH